MPDKYPAIVPLTDPNRPGPTIRSLVEAVEVLTGARKQSPLAVPLNLAQEIEEIKRRLTALEG